MAPKPIPAEQRFWKFVDKTDSCWLWTGFRLPKGYGQFSTSIGGKTSKFLAHRFAYELVIGPIPEGMELDHIVCDNPPCVNPWHAKPLTPEEHSRRGTKRSRSTCCKRGHEFTEENTYLWWGKGSRALGRHCRACRSECSRTRNRRKAHGR